MMYYMGVVWHWIYMLLYYTIVTIGWCLEMVLVFATFFLGGFLLGRSL